MARAAARSRTSAFRHMTLLLSRGRALTDDFRQFKLSTALHRTRFVCLGIPLATYLRFWGFRSGHAPHRTAQLPTGPPTARARERCS